MVKVIERILVPAGLLAALLIVGYALATAADRELILAVVPLAFLLVLSGLELGFGRWRPRLRTCLRDSLCLTIGGGLDAAARILVAWLALALGGPGFGPAAWLPVWVALPLGLLAADFGAYVVHRVFHARPFLWRVHALHHHPDELYALMSSVNGPLMIFIVRAVPIALLVLLGFSAEVAFAYALIDAWIGLVQHTGVDTRNPWLAKLLMTPEVHRLHHSADPAHAGNYALMFCLWDRVFGTYVAPREQVPTPGLAEPDALAATWLGLLLLRRPARRES
ncbi:MAG TPA: sterol desaturase family protein [Enhygromyxa sp.]|nr:sterol desaturase family protein [Enhygromyxa sp.]